MKSSNDEGSAHGYLFTSIKLSVNSFDILNTLSVTRFALLLAIAARLVGGMMGGVLGGLWIFFLAAIGFVRRCH
ncbi:MAG: hypothetical protein QXL67_02395, partial [Candidatus Bathyarchaeia archaeon]